MHELERERAIRVFSKRNEFRTDGLVLEECDTELNEHRKVESELILEHGGHVLPNIILIINHYHMDYLCIVFNRKYMHMTMYIMIKRKLLYW